MTYGFYKYGQGVREAKYVYPAHCVGIFLEYLADRTCSELAREKTWARIHLIPVLQAEEDRDQVRRYLADKAREKELLGSETKVYHSDRYVLSTEEWRLTATNLACY